MRITPPLDEEAKADLYRKFRWKYLQVNIHILDLYLERKISSTEVLLFAIIEAAVDVKGDGCYITNSELAKAIGIKNVRNVAAMKARFKKLGLIRTIGTKTLHGQKVPIIETYWTRTSFKDNLPHAFKDRGDVSLKTPNCISLRSIQTSNTQSDCSAIARDKEETSVGFLNRMNIEVAKKYTKFDLDCASQFRKIVTAPAGVQTFIPKNNIDREANEFKILRNRLMPEHGILTERLIRKVLDWYCENRQSIKFPKAEYVTKAIHFRKQFQKILDLVEPAESKMKITPLAEQVYEELRRLRWPKDSINQLKQAVQITLNGFSAFCQKLETYCVKHPETERTQNSFLMHNLRRTVKTRYHATEWMKRVFRQIAEWKDWNGTLIGMAYNGDLRCKKFAELIVPMISAWTGRPEIGNSTFDRLIKELESCK